jgi:hypothetical protein
MWYNPGTIKQSDVVGGYFDPHPVVILPFAESEALESTILADQFRINATATDLWKMCCDCYAWGIALGNIVSELDYVLGENSD